MSCCAIDQSDNMCSDVKPTQNDPACAKLANCCAGISDHGLQRQCHERVRECRKLGNAWDPIAPLRPLPTKYLVTDRPGYTTQGELVEGFGFAGLSLECITKGMFCALLVALLLKYLFKTEITLERIIGVSLLAAVIQCMLKTL